MEAQEPRRFVDLLGHRIEELINRNRNSDALTPESMRSIRDTIRNTVDSVFLKSDRHSLSPTARSWLADQYFKRVRINEDQCISDVVVLHEHTLSQLTRSDVELLRTLFSGTEIGQHLADEQRRRDAS